MGRKLSLSLVMALSVLVNTTDAYAHAGPLNQFAVQACVEKAKSQACRYEGGHNDLYIGTCQYMAADLMCVRNQPIQKVEAKGEAKPTHQHEKLN